MNELLEFLFVIAVAACLFVVCIALVVNVVPLFIMVCAITLGYLCGSYVTDLWNKFSKQVEEEDNEDDGNETAGGRGRWYK